jgi:hypothetical protein
LEKGVVSLEDGTCYYYSETVGEGIELYCKLSANSKSKLISYFENVSLIYEHDSCSVKVSSSQIGQVTNPLEELIDSGSASIRVCNFYLISKISPSSHTSYEAALTYINKLFFATST